jgi:hypothetical protein
MPYLEPGLDQLLNMIFADDNIHLRCVSGQCLYPTQVPGYKVNLFFCLFFITWHEQNNIFTKPSDPAKKGGKFTLVLTIVVVFLFVISLIAGIHTYLV